MRLKRTHAQPTTLVWVTHLCCSYWNRLSEMYWLMEICLRVTMIAAVGPGDSRRESGMHDLRMWSGECQSGAGLRVDQTRAV